MGKQQKLKEMRRELRMTEQAAGPSKAAYVVAILCIVGAGLIGWKIWSGKTKTPDTSKIPEVSVMLTPETSLAVSLPNFTPVASHHMSIETSKGVIALELYRDVAPKTVDNFVKLAKEGFYSGTKFHRVIADFMIQGGDPNSKNDNPSDDGQGGPGYDFADEINPKSLGLSDAEIKGLESQGYVYGEKLNSLPVDPDYIAMANRGPATNGSQFFIVTTKPQRHLYGKHTVFGKVVDGMDIVQKIEQGDVITKITVKER